jgi:hypothetical protein
MLIKIIKEQIEKQQKAHQRHLNNIAARDKKQLEDPHDIKSLRFLPQDEGREFTRSTVIKRQNKGVLFTNPSNITFTNTVTRIDTFKCVEGRAVLLSSKEVNTYTRPLKNNIFN